MSLLPVVVEHAKILRKRHNLTQEEVAQITGLGYKFYQKLESGTKKQIWLETVERLAEAYGLTVSEFLGPKLPDESHVGKVIPSNVHIASGRDSYGRGKRPAKKRSDGGLPEHSVNL